MATTKQDHNKKDLIILDFDDSLYLNLKQDFTLNIQFENIIDAYTFFNEFSYQTGNLIPKNTEFMLITGRYGQQEQVILYYLSLKGYRINYSHFIKANISTSTPIDEDSFMIDYWTAKVKLINLIKQNDNWKSIIVVDNDSVICEMLRKLNFQAYNIELSKHIPTQTLSVRFRTPRKRRMSELQTFLKPTRDLATLKRLRELRQSIF